jgi:hypothetical protein
MASATTAAPATGRDANGSDAHPTAARTASRNVATAANVYGCCMLSRGGILKIHS